MNDSLFKQFVHRVDPGSDAKEVESEAADDFGAFGFLRGVRDRAIMLELRLKDGSVRAFGNSWLERVEFDPSEGYSLYFGSHVVRIEGRNLAQEVRPNVRLLDGLMRHRIVWLREFSEPEVMRAGADALVIESISIE
jgi:hypothetical protein